MAMAARAAMANRARKNEKARKGKKGEEDEPKVSPVDGLTPQQYAELRDLFDQFDVDGSGAHARFVGMQRLQRGMTLRP